MTLQKYFCLVIGQGNENSSHRASMPNNPPTDSQYNTQPLLQSSCDPSSTSYSMQKNFRFSKPKRGRLRSQNTQRYQVPISQLSQDNVP